MVHTITIRPSNVKWKSISMKLTSVYDCAENWGTKIAPYAKDWYQYKHVVMFHPCTYKGRNSHLCVRGSRQIFGLTRRSQANWQISTEHEGDSVMPLHTLNSKRAESTTISRGLATVQSRPRLSRFPPVFILKTQAQKRDLTEQAKSCSQTDLPKLVLTNLKGSHGGEEFDVGPLGSNDVCRNISIIRVEEEGNIRSTETSVSNHHSTRGSKPEDQPRRH